MKKKKITTLKKIENIINKIPIIRNDRVFFSIFYIIIAIIFMKYASGGTFFDTSTADFNNGYFYFTNASNGNLTLQGLNTSGLYISKLFDTGFGAPVYQNATIGIFSPANTNYSYSFRSIDDYSTSDTGLLFLAHLSTTTTADYSANGITTPARDDGFCFANGTYGSLFTGHGFLNVSSSVANPCQFNSTRQLIYNMTGMSCKNAIFEITTSVNWATNGATTKTLYAFGNQSSDGGNRSSLFIYANGFYCYMPGSAVFTKCGSWIYQGWKDGEKHTFTTELNGTGGYANFYIDGVFSERMATSLTGDPCNGSWTYLEIGNRNATFTPYPFYGGALSDFSIKTLGTGVRMNGFNMSGLATRNSSNTTDIFNFDDGTRNGINGNAPTFETKTIITPSPRGTGNALFTNNSAVIAVPGRVYYASNLVNFSNQGTIQMWVCQTNSTWDITTTQGLFKFANSDASIIDAVALYKQNALMRIDFYNSSGTAFSIYAPYGKRGAGECNHYAFSWTGIGNGATTLLETGNHIALYINGISRTDTTSASLGFLQLNQSGNTNMSFGTSGAAPYTVYDDFPCLNCTFEDIHISNTALKTYELDYWKGLHGSSTADLSYLPSNRYIQYIVKEETDDTIVSPILQDITINYLTDNVNPLLFDWNITYAGNLTSGKLYNVSANVTDQNMGTVWCWINNSAGVITQSTASLQSGSIYYCQSTAGTIGTHYYKLNTTDSWGNSNNSMEWQPFNVSSPNVLLGSVIHPDVVYQMTTFGIIVYDAYNDSTNFTNKVININDSFTGISYTTTGNKTIFTLTSPLNQHLYSFNITYYDSYGNTWTSDNHTIKIIKGVDEMEIALAFILLGLTFIVFYLAYTLDESIKPLKILFLGMGLFMITILSAFAGMIATDGGASATVINLLNVLYVAFLSITIFTVFWLFILFLGGAIKSMYKKKKGIEDE